MALQVGIVGLPNVGKSTLFQALTRKTVDISNYPFCTIEPNVGVVEVPDERLWKLSAFSGSAKTVPAVVEFVDIAGLVKGASEGEGLGNKFLANIREVDAIVEVVRVFQNDNIIHVHNVIDPLGDIEVINTELMLADLETVTKRKLKTIKEARTGSKEAMRELELLERIEAELAAGRLLHSFLRALSDESDRKAVKELQLLTTKPFLYVYNVSDIEAALSPELEAHSHTKLDIKLEEELGSMSVEETHELGMESHIGDLIREAYALLELETFFTTGEDESRAWTILRGSTAPRAGAAIHGDFEERFIRAEVIFWKDLLVTGSYVGAREAGKLRIEGKEYVVGDGDVIVFKI